LVHTPLLDNDKIVKKDNELIPGGKKRNKKLQANIFLDEKNIKDQGRPYV